MQHKKDRILALDYFRGISMLIVLINHSAIFSYPYGYLVGYGKLWTGSAGIFMLISGVTFWVARGEKVLSNFEETKRKSWSRALKLYLLNNLIVILLLGLSSVLLTHNLTNYIFGANPTASGFHLLLQIFTLSYYYGSATFLMLYAAYLLLAPFASYALKTRYWLSIPLLSIIIFIASATSSHHYSSYTPFGVWQIYFFLGLTIGRFRLPILGWFYSQSNLIKKALAQALLFTSSIVLFLSILTEFNLFPIVNKLTIEGWLPIKLRSAYAHLLIHKPQLDHFFMDDRFGLLRPLVAVLFLGAAYLIYQKYKDTILKRSDNFVITIGRNTLAIFVAQAFVIPIMAALPVPRSIVFNTLMTFIVITSMWQVAKRAPGQILIRRYQSATSKTLALLRHAVTYNQELFKTFFHRIVSSEDQLDRTEL
jgi:hypothetical protein